MTKWSGKSRGGVAGYRIFVFLIKYLGIKSAYLILRFVAFYFLIVSKKAPSFFYFHKVLHYSSFISWLSIYKNYCLLGEMMIDKIAFLSGSYTKFTYSFEGEEYLHKMSDEGKGGILIGAHMGNWEMAGQLLERINTVMNIVMFEAEHLQIEAYLKSVLVNKNLNIIPIKEDLSHLARIKEAFERNEMVAVHGDRYLPGAATTSVNFMGMKALFPTGPIYMASKFGVPVSYVVTVKETKNHYHFYATSPKVLPYPSKITTRNSDLNKLTQEFATSLEYRLKQYPLQWFNYYQFWETSC